MSEQDVKRRPTHTLKGRLGARFFPDVLVRVRHRAQPDQMMARSQRYYERFGFEPVESLCRNVDEPIAAGLKFPGH